ncbi:MAG: restriction system protein [Chthoniobacter sp.]|jgi:hypothetical protein|nr:restriction system protein [Chthoniobacter sp.]
MAADALPNITEALNHEVYTKIVPALLVAGVIGIVVMILRDMGENWLMRTIRGWKQRRRAKKYAGMSDDEVLDTPHCPVCNRPMKLRTAKKDGSQFWGCSAFPKCRGTRSFKSFNVD